MNIWIRTPFSQTKNLGAAYNREMELIPDNDTAVFIDGDCQFLTPDYGNILHEYANRYPYDVQTCFANRIHELAWQQRYVYPNEKYRNDFIYNLKEAKKVKGDEGHEVMKGPVSGFLIMIPKHIWKIHPFAETNTFRPSEPNLLGCDNEWTNRIRKAGVRIIRMNKLLVWHTYRLLDGSKQHLL